MRQQEGKAPKKWDTQRNKFKYVNNETENGKVETERKETDTEKIWQNADNC